MKDLPETLALDGVALAAFDCGASVVLIFAAAFLHEARAATLVCTTCVLASIALRRYRESFAVSAIDERYAVATAATVSFVLLVGLVPLFQVSAIASIVTLVLWTLASAQAATRRTRARRATTSGPQAICGHISASSRKRVRDGLLRAVVVALDLVLATIGLVVLSPLLLVCALLIVSGDGGPVVFRQTRVGIDGRPFVMYKFRTMHVDANADWVKPQDERITRIGAFLRRSSLDELPQLWNVLRGEMSLVGPRPEMYEYARQFSQTIPEYEDRHAIPPGITGWAQIHCARNFQPDQAQTVVPYDLFYVANYSVPLYLYCLTKTAFEVLAHRAV